MKPIEVFSLFGLLGALCCCSAAAGVGDPQVKTDHPWYPGELACSTFERLAQTQADVYERVTGARPKTDEDRVLAAWLWRNTHYWHGEQGVEDLWGKGFSNDTDSATRDYWTGLFAHGFGLCGTTHAQWTAEMEHLLGHNRARCVGVTGHNSFEVFLTGGAYGEGRWTLLDHDVSTVIFDDAGRRLLSIAEVKDDVARYTQQNTTAAKQRGWPVCGLYQGDGAAFDAFRSAEYLAGYAGPPPVVHLRRGEKLRRYTAPGLDDGQTFVFWGRNYNTAGIPGPERSRTWVNQPEQMHGAREDAGHKPGQARFANAVYTYQPDFASGDYREGVIDESESHVVFEFQTPYIIAATPASDEPWAIYEQGCRNGLIVSGAGDLKVAISVDRGQTWQAGGVLGGALDLTDMVKGCRQYWICLEAGAEQLRDSGLRMTTVCQANSSIVPRLSDNGSLVEFSASGTALISAGPNVTQAQAHVVEGAFGTPRVTLELTAPRRQPAVHVYVAAHVQSSNPPSPEIAYHIDCSTDGGKSWQAVVSEWRITRRGVEPDDFWSQSFCYGGKPLDEVRGPVRVRFRNDRGKPYRRAEAHLAYRTAQSDAMRVAFCWRDDQGQQTGSHVFAPRRQGGEAQTWRVPTGANAKTLWVEYEPQTAADAR